METRLKALHLTLNLLRPGPVPSPVSRTGEWAQPGEPQALSHKPAPSPPGSVVRMQGRRAICT